MTFRAKISKCL